MNEFLQPPTKELNSILQSNDIKPHSAKVPEWFAKLLSDINDAEETCLKTIHARYCIPRALNISITDISRAMLFENRPNYWEYWYNYNDSKTSFFLMSREVTLNEKGMPVLDVKFNKVLAREGE